MNSTLSDYHQAFVDALFGMHRPELAHLTCQPGFAVYRNSIMKACIDALEANFPSVVSLTGQAFFREMAAEYCHHHRPHEVELIRYGECFPAFIERYIPASSVPYLAAVAEVDWLWLTVFCAADSPLMDGQALARINEQELARLVLTLRQPVRWYGHATLPIFTLWYFNRYQTARPVQIDWQGEGVLLVRRGQHIIAQSLSLGGVRFLDACRQGNTLNAACEQALQIEPEMNIGLFFRELLTAGVFAELTH